jgi:outer membrane protein assembly factor BamB
MNTSIGTRLTALLLTAGLALIAAGAGCENEDKSSTAQASVAPATASGGQESARGGNGATREGGVEPAAKGEAEVAVAAAAAAPQAQPRAGKAPGKTAGAAAAAAPASGKAPAVPAAPKPRAGWYRWRGPEQNGVSRETNLPEEWDLEGGDDSNLVWENEVGGMSSPIVMNGKVYTLTRIGEVEANDTLVAGTETQEALVAIDASNGKVLWTHAENMTQTDVPFHRIGWSNVVGDPETGRVYALGAQTTLVCLDGESGKVVWKRQMTEEFGMISTFGGRTPSPVVDEDQLFVAGVSFGWGDHARSSHRMFCFDKNTGELRWSEGTGGIPVDSPYNTPVVANIAGQRTVVFGAGDGTVTAFQARTGKKLWSHKISQRGLNASVVVEGDHVFACSGEVNPTNSRMGAVVCIDASGAQPKELWRVEGIEAGFGTATIANGRLYVIDSGAMIHALDAKTGKAFWRKKFGTIGKASLVWADGKLFHAEANGRFFILRDEGDKVTKVHEADVEEKLGREYSIFGSVAIADGRIYLQAANRMYCIGKKDAEAAKVEIPEQPAEKQGTGNIASVQVLPYDVVTRPGDQVKLAARAFNELGQPVETEAQPAWSIGQLTFIPPPKRLPDAPPAKGDQERDKVREGGPAAARPADAPTDLASRVSVDPADAAPVAPDAAAAIPAADQPPKAPAAAPAGGDQPAPQKIGNLQGEVSADGTFTAGQGQHQGGAVVAAFGDKSGYARVRVVPKLPWSFDFEKAPVDKPPLTWLGAGGKFAVRELKEGVDGKPTKALTKLTDIDLYARARTNFGTVEMSNLTLQADVRVGTVMAGERRQMPDAGVINNRYVLVLLGNHQRLEIHAWPSALPEAWHKTIPFKWEPNAWYRLKLKVTPQGERALVEGKAWPAGEPEPKEWSIRVEDPRPNPSGAPGVYGNSLVTPIKSEIYYDNVLLTPNAGAGDVPPVPDDAKK